MKVVFLGGQGSGKSTQAKMLAEKLNLPYIEMGQLLRDKSKDQDEEGQEIHKALAVGNLVPNQITIRALEQRLKEPDSIDGFILDGYPRNKQQWDALNTKADKAIYIKVNDEEATQRLLKRGRHDDNEASIKRRLELYHSETEPLLSQFKKEGILVEIPGERPIADIHEDVLKALKYKQAFL